MYPTSERQGRTPATLTGTQPEELQWATKMSRPNPWRLFFGANYVAGRRIAIYTCLFNVATPYWCWRYGAMASVPSPALVTKKAFKSCRARGQQKRKPKNPQIVQRFTKVWRHHFKPRIRSKRSVPAIHSSFAPTSFFTSSPQILRLMNRFFMWSSDDLIWVPLQELQHPHRLQGHHLPIFHFQRWTICSAASNCLGLLLPLKLEFHEAFDTQGQGWWNLAMKKSFGPSKNFKEPFCRINRAPFPLNIFWLETTIKFRAAQTNFQGRFHMRWYKNHNSSMRATTDTGIVGMLQTLKADESWK